MALQFSLEKRTRSAPHDRLLVLGAALVLALAMGGLFLLAVEVNPLEAYPLLWQEVFLSPYGQQDLLIKVTPLLLTGIAVAVAAQMKQWNIGAEGQFHMGTFLVTWVALNITLESSVALLILMAFAGMLGGGIWGAIPGWLKARLGVNEIITSLLLNYVAASWIDHLLFGPWKDPGSNNFPITPEFPEAAQFPYLGETNVHAGIVMALCVILIVAWLLQKTKLGFTVQLTGDNPDAARYSGVKTRTLVLLVFVASGAIAGLAGFNELAGIHYRLQQDISIGYGYTGIIVAWLARNHPLGIIPSALFLASIFVSAEVLQIDYGLPISMVFLFQGVILFTVLGSEIFTEYRLRVRRIAAA